MVDLDLVQVVEVVDHDAAGLLQALGSEMTGNVPAEFRIDGWKQGTWYQGHRDILQADVNELWDVTNITLTLDLEDGKVSGSFNDEARLGFICQRSENDESTGCKNPSGIPKDSDLPGQRRS